MAPTLGDTTTDALGTTGAPLAHATIAHMSECATAMIVATSAEAEATDKASVLVAIATAMLRAATDKASVLVAMV